MHAYVGHVDGRISQQLTAIFSSSVAVVHLETQVCISCVMFVAATVSIDKHVLPFLVLHCFEKIFGKILFILYVVLSTVVSQMGVVCCPRKSGTHCP